MKESTALRRAARLIDQYGHNKHFLGNKSTGFCLAGARCRVLGVNTRIPYLVAEEHFTPPSLELGEFPSLHSENHNLDKQSAVLALLFAAELADEQ